MLDGDIDIERGKDIDEIWYRIGIWIGIGI